MMKEKELRAFKNKEKYNYEKNNRRIGGIEKLVDRNLKNN